ncbi:hypothetical protein NDA13_006530 [Ustilago tritici]|nr:hypothetical protein NDA13_006530 [Ustilago tritici]
MPANSTFTVCNDASDPAVMASDNTGDASGVPTNTATTPTRDLSLEPDQGAFVAIKTGQLVWTRTRTNKPVAPYEDLPFPKSGQAKLPPCTVRWQFTGCFNLNRKEDVTHGSIRVQIQCFLVSKGIIEVQCHVNFPCGVGHGRFVEITVPADHLQIVKDAPLVFNGEALQHLFLGPALECTSLVVEVLNFPNAKTLKETGQYITQTLKEYVQVHDVWVAQISYANDPTPPEDTNCLHLLVTIPPGRDGGMDPSKQHTIPGFLHIGKHKCELQYSGQLEWCNTCKSTSEFFHTFNNCPHHHCYNCGKTSHAFNTCPEEFQGNTEMADQQAEETCHGTNNLNYSSV